MFHRSTQGKSQMLNVKCLVVRCEMYLFRVPDYRTFDIAQQGI